MERALGVRWLLEGDHLAIKVQPNSRPATRRGVLSLVTSIYDPLGFVAPFIVRAKILFQCECRHRLGWDEPLSAVNHTTWSTWLGELAHLEKLSEPRCLKTACAKEIISAQLHTFCDASQAAYSAVTYLRMVDSGGSIQCSFVYERAKLAPLKQLTIPRLELCAAVLAVNADRTIRREMTMTIHESYFWTDSMLVLQYITNSSRQFQTFVANRIAVIQELSRTDQWRHVGTSLNPADDATRGLPVLDLVAGSRWMRGPDFLFSVEEWWPKGKELPAVLNDCSCSGSERAVKVVPRQTVAQVLIMVPLGERGGMD
ncbi:uncharacterized protein LOC121871731 [Homarus americanus]|uniref:uncharacterized protein LOC121871731 n=1 Tax=Homarus americanus TaxID=6706 RepID=UPI001C45F346|nr:uncharacterized protein LOC121871731 [Homarus americanus]